MSSSKGIKKPTVFQLNIVKKLLAGESATKLNKEKKVPISTLYGWKEKYQHLVMEDAKKDVRDNIKKLVEPSTTTVISELGTRAKFTAIYLRQAREQMNKELKQGRVKNLLKSQLLTLMALNELTGE